METQELQQLLKAKIDAEASLDAQAISNGAFTPESSLADRVEGDLEWQRRWKTFHVAKEAYDGAIRKAVE